MEQEINETTLRLRVPSLTLNKHDIRELCNIVVKAADNPKDSIKRFIVSRDRESVSTYDIDKLISAKWPQEINAATFEAYDDNNFIRVSLNSNRMGANEVIISSHDSDWVTIRAKEIDDFIVEHKNWHWILHNLPLVFTFAIVLAAMLGAGIGIALKLPIIHYAIPSMFGFVALVYGLRGISEVYTFIIIEGSRSSVKYKLRRFLNWVIPTVVAGIFMNLLWQLVIHISG